MKKTKLRSLKLLSAKIRVDILEMIRKAGGGHLGGSLSIVEVLSVLYGKQMKYDYHQSNWENRDYLV